MIPSDAIPVKIAVQFSEQSFCDATALLIEILCAGELDSVVLFVSVLDMAEASRIKEIINNNMGNFKISELLLDCDLLDLKDQHCDIAFGAFYVSAGGKCVYSPGI